MAGFPGSSNPPLSHHQNQQNLSAHHQNQRVALSEIPGKIKMYADIQEPNSRRRRQRSGFCSTCGPCACIIATAFFIFLSVLGFIVVGYLESSLPKIYVKKVEASNITFTETAGQKFLAIDVHIALEFDNENDKIIIQYESPRAVITAEHVRIGHTTLRGFSQKPGNETNLYVNTTTANSPIDDANAEMIKMMYKQKAMVVDLVMTGDVCFNLGGWKMKNLPFEVSCIRVNEAYLKSQDPQKCFTQLLLYRGFS